MKANTAFCFLCSGVSLLSQQQEGNLRRYVSKLGQLCAIVVFAIASLTLAQYIFNWDFGIDQLLFQETTARIGTYPGRMAPNSAINFILTSLALLLLPQKFPHSYKLVELCVLTATIISGISLIGYAYDVESLYRISSYASPALHTAITFIIISGGILLTQPEQGMVKIITSRNMGGFIARRLLISAVVVPFILGLLIHQGQQSGLYNPSFGLSVLVMANISIFVALIWQNAKILDRLDRRRQQVENELQETLATLQALIKASPLAIVSLDNEAKLKLWSPAAESIFGWSEQEVLGQPVPFVQDDKLEEFQRLHQIKLQGGILTNIEVQRQKKDGSIIDVAIWGAPLPDAQGNINSTMAVIADITERKRTQAALKANEEQFRQLAENIRDVFWTIDLQQQQLIYVSPAYEKIWRRSCEDLLRNTPGWLATIHPDDRNALEDSFSARMDSENFAEFSWQEFERTYRIVRPEENSSTTRTYGGLGLGLAIVRHLVELHGGTVWGDSLGEGKGASFSVLLPLASPLAEVDERSHSGCVLSPFHSNHEEAVLRDDLLALNGLRVLVVDDEADARELVATMLRQYGVEVTEAASAVEGLATLQRLMPNVLISDIRMPDENGYSLIRKVRALAADAGGAIPALALTAYAREEDQENAIAADFSQHLPKPINPLHLVETVAKLAGQNWRI